MSGSDTSDNELTKEERLEIAKRKLKEMKKKKKNPDKKKKKSESTTNESETENETQQSKEITPVEQISRNNQSKEEGGEAEAEPDQPIDKSNLKHANTESTNSHIEEKTSEVKHESISNESATESAEPVSQSKNEDPDETSRNSSSEIDRLNHTIKKLRDENTNLKLEIMDLKDKISELEVTNSQQHPHTQPTFKENIKPAKPVFTKNDYANISQQNLQDFNTMTDNFRDKLMIWKNWQVDMTSWNEIQANPKIAL